ncbi:hypothetical protein HYW35_04155 [Candidatus Saccharibacteria bacterium]|nr:hypothetical protein [Candidatus Saccharibacteria bacterium]
MRQTSRKTGRRRLFKARGSRVFLNYYRSSKPETSSSEPSTQKISTDWLGKKRLLYKLRNFGLLILLLWLSIHSLILQPSPQISLSNTTYRSAADYKQAITHELKSLLNRNKITLNKKAVEIKLKRQFPEITSLSINIGVFSQIPRVKLVIDGPSFNLSSAAETYVVNAQGVAVAKSANLAASSQLPNLIDQTNFKVELGKQVLAASEVTFINNLLAQCRRSSVPVASLTLPPLAQELDLRTADKSYLVKFYLGADASQQIGQFLAARHDFDVRGQQPASYLDVRVPGKVYFK